MDERLPGPPGPVILEFLPDFGDRLNEKLAYIDPLVAIIKRHFA